MTPLILLVWLHGFKGSQDTFGTFPTRIQSILSSSYTELEFSNVIYPSYDTRGQLIDAVDNFVSWLTELVVEKQQSVDTRDEKDSLNMGDTSGEKREVRVILLGHSMGGLVIADSILLLNKVENPWPKIIGAVLFDSPMVGLNPAVFSNTASKYLSTGQTAITALSGGWAALSSFSSKADNTSKVVVKKEEKSSWLNSYAIAAIAVATVGAGAAYYSKDSLLDHFNWATSHLSYVVELWKTEELSTRLDNLEKWGQNRKFVCFYTLLPPDPQSPTNYPPRTFIILPKKKDNFFQNVNSKVKDEVQAHVDMFDEVNAKKGNDGIYLLGQETTRALGRMIELEDLNGKAKLV